jgi:hypothetical protein
MGSLFDGEADGAGGTWEALAMLCLAGGRLSFGGTGRDRPVSVRRRCANELARQTSTEPWT